jgi:hypothetical protein
VEYTYPFLYFAVGDFDETWKDITLTKDGELVCIELFAVGDYFTRLVKNQKKKHSSRCRLFAGALDYSVINREYKSKTGLWSSGSKQFFNLSGPGGKGAAEMAVQPQAPQTQQPTAPAADSGITFGYMSNFCRFVLVEHVQSNGGAIKTISRTCT